MLKFTWSVPVSKLSNLDRWGSTGSQSLSTGLKLLAFYFLFCGKLKHFIPRLRDCEYCCLLLKAESVVVDVQGFLGSESFVENEFDTDIRWISVSNPSIS